MSNANYQRGVRWERTCKKAWEARGYTVLRTAGSHGFADLVCLKPDRVVTFVQCKCLKHGIQKDAYNMTRKFMKTPPFLPNVHFHQVLEVYAMKDGHQERVTV